VAPEITEIFIQTCRRFTIQVWEKFVFYCTTNVNHFRSTCQPHAQYINTRNSWRPPIYR